MFDQPLTLEKAPPGIKTAKFGAYLGLDLVRIEDIGGTVTEWELLTSWSADMAENVRRCF